MKSKNGMTFESFEKVKKTQPFLAWIRSLCTIQFFFLALLTIQNTAAVMLMSYTQQRQSADASARYEVSHVVMMQEATKVIASVLWCALDVFLATRSSFAFREEIKSEDASLEEKEAPTNNGRYIPLSNRRLGEDEMILPGAAGLYSPISSNGRWRRFVRSFAAEILNYGALWMGIPAVLYLIQNYVLFVALGNLEPTLFQVTYQTKIIGTAVLMWAFLDRSFTFRQWASLVLLVFGVAMAQLGARSSTSDSDSKHVITGSYAVGIFATLSAVALSSTASVLIEAIFKSKLGPSSAESHTSTKNVHLSAFSVLCLAVGQVFNNASFLASTLNSRPLTTVVKDYFRGFDYLVWILVIVQALGGLLVALVIKHSDNIMKAFATGCAIVLSGVCSVFIYSFTPSYVFTIGNALCLAAIFLYNR